MLKEDLMALKKFKCPHCDNAIDRFTLFGTDISPKLVREEAPDESLEYVISFREEDNGIGVIVSPTDKEEHEKFFTNGLSDKVLGGNGILARAIRDEIEDSEEQIDLYCPKCEGQVSDLIFNPEKPDFGEGEDAEQSDDDDSDAWFKRLD